MWCDELITQFLSTAQSHFCSLFLVLWFTTSVFYGGPEGSVIFSSRKRHANKQSTNKFRKHLHQADNARAANAQQHNKCFWGTLKCEAPAGFLRVQAEFSFHSSVTSNLAAESILWKWLVFSCFLGSSFSFYFIHLLISLHLSSINVLFACLFLLGRRHR